LAAPNIPLKYQSYLAVANSKFPSSRVEKVRFYKHSVLQWHLSRIGPSPLLGNFKCTSEKKSFSPSKGRKKITPQNQLIWL
jgi:hypothetical protein